MVSHSLAIAKASLAAACIRPDPTSVPRDQVNVFHELLDTALECCSRQNIQRCTQWLVANVVQSTTKATAIAKYLTVVSASYKDPKDAVPPAKHRHRQLHILYLLNDVLHTTKFHGTSSEIADAFSQSISAHTGEILADAAIHDLEKYPRHRSKLTQLLEIWKVQQYFSASFIHSLEEILRDPSTGKKLSPPADSAANEQDASSVRKEDPFEMPAIHGDPSASYYELPAATMLPHIIPKRKIPIDPKQMAALHFKPGPADKVLVSAVKVFLRDADEIYGLEVEEDPDISARLDEIGQIIHQDKVTGEIVGGESYYGWSKQFCERMKRPPSEASSRSRSRGRSEDRPRRRNFSSMDRSGSSSFSRSPPRRRRRHSRSRQRSSDLSRSRSRSQHAHRRAASPPQSGFGSHQLPRPANTQAQAPLAFQGQGAGFPAGMPQPPPPLPFPFPDGVPFGPDGLPIPPPRPPNWQGPWPPPPPPSGNLPPRPF